MKTILFVHHGASIGGAPICLFEIVRRIDRKKYKILIVLPEEGSFSALLKEEGITYIISPLFTFYYCSLAHSLSVNNPFLLNIKSLYMLLVKAIMNSVHFVKIIRKENPDMVIINTSTPLICGIIAKIMKKQVIWHIREIISTERSIFLKKLIASVINFSAEKVIVPSEFALRDLSNLKIRNMIPIYDGAVSLSKFRKKNKEKGANILVQINE